MCELCSGISRRVFLGTSAALSAGLLFGEQASSDVALPIAANEWDQQPPVKVYVILMGHIGGWPGLKYDTREAVENVFSPYLEKLQQKLGNVVFVGGDHIPQNPNAVQELLPKIEESEAEAILGIHLTGCNSDAPFRVLCSTGLPVAIYAQPYSGHEWIYVPYMQQEGAKIILGASRDINEIERLVSLLRVPAKMKKSKLILVSQPGYAAGSPEARDFDQVREKFGTEVIHVTPAEFVEIHQTIPEEDAIAEAENYWINQAREIREPSREEIIKSCKTYFALKKLMKERGAIALAMQCLGGVPIDILGYPCLGFSRLLDDGAIGACEADMDSTLSMMMFLFAMGRPGFITDPVMDMATNSVIHAHCVSSTKMDGPQSERLPFIIRSHLEDEKGASLKVIVDRDINREVTWVKLVHNNTILVTSGLIREDYDSGIQGCRTKIVAEVTSSTARELLSKWGGNVIGRDVMTLLHRVVFYGNHLDDFRDIAQLMELKFMIEGKDWA
ncbi:MAG: hypothetical protein FWH27_04590 [Planctomycetaceae bacterium]|nr:hypothetical protein [Planctomycetaceae bacterium]